MSLSLSIIVMRKPLRTIQSHFEVALAPLDSHQYVNYRYVYCLRVHSTTITFPILQIGLCPDFTHHNDHNKVVEVEMIHVAINTRATFWKDFFFFKKESEYVLLGISFRI